MSYEEDLRDPQAIRALLSRKEFAVYKLPRHSLDKELESFATTKTERRLLNPNRFDDLLREAGALFLQPHQGFGRAFFNPHTPWPRVYLKQGTGTGKTIAGLAIAQDFIGTYQEQRSAPSSQADALEPSVFIVGFSRNTYQRELLRRPEFGFVSQEEIREHRRLRHLADKGGVPEREALADFETRLRKRLTNRHRGGFYKFYGYKELFNRLFIFPDGEELSDAPALYAALRAGRITINWDLVDTFVNSLMLCDEIHNVYNAAEVNNYGIALRVLLDIFDVAELLRTPTPEPAPGSIAGLLAAQPGFTEERLARYRNSSLRVVYSSATPIGSSPAEIVDLINLIVPVSRLPDRRPLSRSDFFVDSRNLKRGALDQISLLLRGTVLYLQDNNPKYFPRRIIEGDQLPIPAALASERAAGYKGKHVPYLRFIRCPMSPLQYKVYRQVYDGTLPPDGQTLMDFVLPRPPPKTGDTADRVDGLFRGRDMRYEIAEAPAKWRATHHLDVQDEQITGDIWHYENLIPYSPKYCRMLDALFANLARGGGKVIISHQLVRNGVLTIQEILRKNGFLDELAAPNADTRCTHCGRPAGQHAGSKAKVHEFAPARFLVVHGDMERTQIDRNIEKFKSRDNLRGELFRILIGSEIINEAADFTAVREHYIMDEPDDFPTLLQIFGRGIRNKSHIDLPPDERDTRILIFVSSIPHGKSASTTELSYEELHYLRKSQDYLVIQQIEAVINATALDSVLHRDTIFPPGLPRDENQLGSLYFEPDPLFGPAWRRHAMHGTTPTPDQVTTTTFGVYHQDEEIALIVYVIKRLFLEQSRVWRYDDLWRAVRQPPFDLAYNAALFSEASFLLALARLVPLSGAAQHAYLNESRSQTERLLDSSDYRLLTPDGPARIAFVPEPSNGKGFFILLPLVEAGRTDDRAQPVGEKDGLGLSLSELTAAPLRDVECWRRPPEAPRPGVYRITNLLKTSSGGYSQMKYRFYQQFRDAPLHEMPTGTEVYDLAFHSRLVEEAIRYAFQTLVFLDAPTSELHDFYFKMLYFYNRLDLIVFACDLPPELAAPYERYVTDNAKGVPAIGEKYNAFLMTSVTRQSGEPVFRFARLAEFLGLRPSRRDLRLQDLIEQPTLDPRRARVRRVARAMLPLGHFITESGPVSIPRLWSPSAPAAAGTGFGAWVRAPEFVQSPSAAEKENDILIGYYERQSGSIAIKFKVRPPIQRIVRHADTRMIERGSACSTHKKEELLEICKSLKLKPPVDPNIKTLCATIKLELMRREMASRRVAQHKKAGERVRWFYLHFETQPDRE